MTIRTHFHLAILLATLVFALVFTVFETTHSKKSQTKMEQHARVIQGALWNFDSESPQEYLTLAAASDNYGQIEIVDMNDNQFLFIEGPPLSLADRFFKSIYLLPEETHTVPILRNGKMIGSMLLTHFHNSIYFHLYTLSSLGLCIIAYMFYQRTLSAKRNLESRVQERTDELAHAMSAAQESEEKFRAFS